MPWFHSRLIPEYRPPTVQAGFYTPPHRVGLMWDTWLYWHEGIYYMYYIAGPVGRWDAHEIAVSPDGVHWDYHGVAVKPRPQTAWIGTGHVWKSPAFDQNGLWILNYSEWLGDKQDIMFATSPDLLHWTKVDESLRFVQDTRWYKAKGAGIASTRSRGTTVGCMAISPPIRIRPRSIIRIAVSGLPAARTASAGRRCRRCPAT